MKAHQAAIPSKNGRKPKNLTLSKDAIDQGEKLAKKLGRPSLSNVVEHLITEAYKQAKAA